MCLVEARAGERESYRFSGSISCPFLLKGSGMLPAKVSSISQEVTRSRRALTTNIFCLRERPPKRRVLHHYIIRLKPYFYFHTSHVRTYVCVPALHGVKKTILSRKLYCRPVLLDCAKSADTKSLRAYSNKQLTAPFARTPSACLLVNWLYSTLSCPSQSRLTDT